VLCSEFVIHSWNCIVSSEIVIRCRNWIVCSELAFAAELCVLQRICDSLPKFSCLQRIHDSLSKLCCLQQNYDSLPKLSCLQRIIIRCRIVCSEGKFMIRGRSGIVCVTTWLSKPKTIVNFLYIYIYLIHMVPVIKELESSHHQNPIHTINSSFKSESYTNT
jgi:hypothetical protein